MPGFIYIMSNPSFVSGRVKIGKSDRDPERFRKDELETTGVPEPFHVEYFALVEDHDALERSLHLKFAEYRVRSSREFFDVSTHLIVKAIYDVTEVFYEKKNYATSPLFSGAAMKKNKDFRAVSSRAPFETKRAPFEKKWLACPICKKSDFYILYQDQIKCTSCLLVNSQADFR